MRIVGSGLAAGLFGLAVIAAPEARAQDTAAANARDVRCVVAGIVASASPDATIKESGKAVLIYYLGRIDGRTPGFDIDKAMKEEGPRMSLNDLVQLGKSCGEALTTRGKALNASTSLQGFGPAAPLGGAKP
jgi:hypothetical protein